MRQPIFATYRVTIVHYPIKKKHARKRSAILLLQVWRDIKSIAAGPLSLKVAWSRGLTSPHFCVSCSPWFSMVDQDSQQDKRGVETCEQRDFYANKAKTEMRHFCLKRRIKNPRRGQHPERARNEIRICII